MLTEKMQVQRKFIALFMVWTETMRTRFNCCLSHSMAAFEQVMEMTEISAQLLDCSAKGTITDEEFIKSMNCCIQQMENEMKTLKKAEKIEDSKEPFVLQKEARA